MKYSHFLRMLVRYTWLYLNFQVILRESVCIGRWFYQQTWLVSLIWAMFVTLTLFSRAYQTVKKYTRTSPNILTCMPYQVNYCRFIITIIVIFKMSKFQSRSRTPNLINCDVLTDDRLQILQVFRAILYCFM